jgi:hypothetical protein
MKHLSIFCLILLLFVGVAEYSVAQTSAPPTSSWAVTPNPGEYGTILFKPVQYGGVFMINGRPMAAGDAIGVFFYEGTVRKCGGYLVWQGTTNDMNYALNVWENDTLTPTVKEGFYPGETLNFLMWDAQLQMEVPVVNLVCNTNGIPAINYPYLGPCQTTYSGSMLFMYDAIYGDALVPPTLVSPEDLSTNVALNPTLSWEAVPTATGYAVQVSTSNTFSTTVYSGTVTNNSVQLSGLLNNTTYYWRVKALRDTIETEWSAIWSFTTLPGVTGYTVSGYIKYKNNAQTPMNNCTVVLKDAQGQTVGTTTTNTQGFYEFTNVADGNYTLQISTTKAWGGVNSLDANFVRQHINNVSTQYTPFTGVRLIASDIVANGAINLLDLSNLRRRLAGLSYSWTAPTYVFYPTSVNVNGNNATLNVESLCSGDVNGSFTPPSN